MIKDKIKPLKQITDDTSIKKDKDEPQTTQCPKCLQLTANLNHKCHENGWWVCSICSLNLEKKQKTISINDTRYITLGRSKKHYRIINSLICYNCAMKISRELKKDGVR